MGSLLMFFWYFFPVIVLFASNYIITTLSLQKRFRLKAPDIATPFLFMGLHEISKDSYGMSILPYFFISILLLGCIVLAFHFVYYKDIQYGRFFKMFWRLVFLLTIILYVVLSVLNLIHHFA